jgi:hypothetical protein
MSKKPKKQHSYNRQDAQMARDLDKLADYEAFCEKILPQLRRMVKDGSSAEAIYKFAESFAAARNVTIALTDGDPGRAMTAIKDILDRSQGKAKERTEHTHKFEKLKDNEIDALLQSRLKETASDDDDEAPH